MHYISQEGTIVALLDQIFQTFLLPCLDSRPDLVNDVSVGLGEERSVPLNFSQPFFAKMGIHTDWKTAAQQLTLNDLVLSQIALIRFTFFFAIESLAGLSIHEFYDFATLQYEQISLQRFICV